MPISAELLPPRFSTKTISAMSASIIFGAINVILFKMQTWHYDLPKNSFQIQVFIIFAGQYLNILFFYLRLKFKRVSIVNHFKNSQRKALFQAKVYKFSRLRILIASLLNFVAVFLQLRVLTFLPPLLFQMILTFGAVFTPFISWMFLKKKIYFHTAIGILFSILGAASMFLTAYIFAIEEIKFDGNLVLTIITMAVSLVFSSAQNIYEEWLSDKIVISSFRFVGLEGLFGILLLTITAVGFQVYSVLSGDESFNIGLDVWTIWNNKFLVWSSLVLIGSSALYELSSITLTRKLSATFKIMNDILKVILVWLAQILLFDFERPDLDVNYYFLYTVARLSSYCLLVFGTLLINEIFELSCCGLDKYWGRYHNTRMNTSLDKDSDEYSIVKF